MRALIMTAGILAAIFGVLTGRHIWERVQEKAGEARRGDIALIQLQKEVLALQALPQRPAVPLSQAYVELMNDMNVLARAHRAAYRVSVPGMKDQGPAEGACPSAWQGVKELRLQVIFSGLTRRGRLVSLLAAVTEVEAASPVLLHGIYYENDALVLELSLLGA